MFIGLTTLISSVIGLLTALAPEFMKEWVTGRNHAREREFLILQAQLQALSAAANADSRLREIEGATQTELVRAMREQLTAIIEANVKPIGIVWIDAFNALLRPGIVCMLMVVFALVFVPYC